MIRNYADHASNERTFLAWVRTAIAVVGFGLGLGRLGRGTGQLWSDGLLIGSGAVVVLIAFVRMRHTRRRILMESDVDDDSQLADLFLVLLMLALFALLGAFSLHILDA